MSFNFFAPPTKDDIRVGYIDPTLGYVDGVSVCEANEYGKNNPGTVFIFRDGDNNIRYLNINEVNGLNPNDLTAKDDKCGGIQEYRECGPPRIQFFGGGGIGAVGNPVIGRDGSLLAVDVVSGGHGYQYPPIVASKDDCEYGNGASLIAILGETADETEVFEGEEDYEDYQLCEETDVGYGVRYGLNGEEIGLWEPNNYTKIGEDPIKREIEIYQKAIQTPFWTTRKSQPDRILVLDQEYTTQNTTHVTFPAWGEFMNKYAVSPVKPSDTRGTDEAGKVFNIEWELNFPISGEYIFRGLCDNTAKVYIDDSLVGNLKSFNDNPTPLQKTIQEGNHIIKVELLNVPITETVTTTTSASAGTSKLNPKFIQQGTSIYFQVDGNGSGEITFNMDVDDNPSFAGIAAREVYIPSDSGRVSLKRDPLKHKTSDKGSGKFTAGKKYGPIQIIGAGPGARGPIVNNPKVLGLRDADGDDLNIKITIGDIKGSSLSGGTSSTTVSEVVSPKSWNENPMGVSMIVDAPSPPIPQEQPPIQTGRCPPNPIWTTRFPGSNQKWYPVRFPSWGRFMNRYAISPILPLNTPGSDTSGVNFTNSWQVDLPYAGYYAVKGTRDNNGRVLIDGKVVSNLDGFSVDNPKLSKVYLEKGRHTITVEILNNPVETVSTIDTKIFSTQDWRVPSAAQSPPAGTSKLKPKFVQQGTSIYFQVDGNGSGEITFNMDVDDNPSFAGIAAREITIPSDGGRVSLKRDPSQHKTSDKGSGKFTAGKKYGPIQIIGAGPGARGPIVNNPKVLGLRDADGDDLNIKITIGNIKESATSPTPNSAPNASQSITKDGVSYSGPELFGHTETRWSDYMNQFSVSPKVFNSISSPENPVVGKYTLTWKNVDFPYGGTYKFNFQADNIASLKIGGKDIFKTSDFIGQKVQYTFNITPGKYDIEIQLENTKSPTSNTDEFIFQKNPMGVALFISKDVVFSDSNKTSWTTNPVGVSAILIPPPCAKKIGGKGVVDKVIVNDPGNGYLPPLQQGPGYPVTLILDEVIVENPGINYRCGEDPIQIVPSNGAQLSYDCDSFGKIRSVKVLNPGYGFSVYPEITIPSETGVNATFRPVFKVVRDPVELENQQDVLIQVTDLVGLKQTGYVNGRAYYGAIYYDEGIPYAGYYKTAGTQIRVYATLQESITAQFITPASAIQRSGTDIRSNDPRLNIPGTPQSTTEET